MDHEELEPYTGFFPPETVELALRVMAEAGGNSVAAHARLEAEFGAALERVPKADTLHDWRTKQYPVRYRAIVNENDVVLEDIVKAQLRTSQVLAGQLQTAALEQLRDRISAVPAERLSGAVRDLATSRAIDLDKLRLLEDKPTQITETRGAPELLRDIAGRLNLIDDDDVPDAEVVP